MEIVEGLSGQKFLAWKFCNNSLILKSIKNIIEFTNSIATSFLRLDLKALILPTWYFRSAICLGAR